MKCGAYYRQVRKKLILGKLQHFPEQEKENAKPHEPSIEDNPGMDNTILK